uniref:NADH-quinone oxidoreductase subunit L n=1 Tax=Candidatus Kentrum sp. FM TaxID=2126340 RepID=A0A450VPV2_9GAMM|nr:MAG: NADH-quinone oxidoreductase subunit L [Candidatus Kentron sp. FM]VFJ45649.1 MAG: NADH-quinone oxidoreductase subunit L [Candidatus Kentron sp. FM]VFK06823.1 MAG: NADH-quinone oxidoreductase subunit L [Candidatus Kentron sp. FM]
MILTDMQNVYLTIALAPLVAAIIAGLFGKFIGRSGAHSVTIGGVAISTALAAFVFQQTVLGDAPVYDAALYTWGIVNDIRFEIGFRIDELSATMMLVVSFVSLMVHIYTIGYMHDDPGYQRFFSYISLFTFGMLMLVMANNFLQLFFGWEMVGLVSYLLIGFWFERESAIRANLKAFLVNRVGDFGFLLGIAAVLMYFGSLHYETVFAAAPGKTDTVIQLWPGLDWSLMSVICILLFIGAMGKSAQVPLHVWLPDSMEGPTPISALIHAATMVTAGIFMVARMSPLYELSETALSVILVIGAITAFFMGLLGIVQNDIKRVVAYSTLSQLGYMTVALGASAYAAAMFHLATHAFFKALLFLAAGSVIIAMHHDQDIRNMGGLRKYLPITWITSLIGSLALIGFPGFSGFFSKDAIIEAVHHSHLPGAGFAYVCVLAGVFVTAFYSFRMYFLVFHGKERMDEHTREHLHETPAVVTLPLILLAIPSVIIGWPFVESVLFGGYFGESIRVLPAHDVLGEMGKGFHDVAGFVVHGLMAWPFLLAMSGVVLAWFFYLKRPDIPETIARWLRVFHWTLLNNYGFDALYQRLFAGGTRGMGSLLWRVGDMGLIDGLLVNGSARAVGRTSGIVRHVQTGLLYHYAFAMIIGVLLLLLVFGSGWRQLLEF